MDQQNLGGTPAVEDVAIQQQHEQEVTQDAPVDEVAESQQQSTDENQEKNRPQRRGGFQKKIDRLQRENEYLRAEIERRAVTQSGPAPSVSEEPAVGITRPKPDDYQSYDDYVEALADYKVEVRLAKAEQRKQKEVINQSYDRQIKEARDLYPDFDEALADAEDDFKSMPQHAMEAILHSDVGAHIAYYVANNPEVGEQLSKLDRVRAAIFVGQLGERVKSHIEKGSQRAKISKAPAPISPVQTSRTPQKDVTRMSFDEFREAHGYNKL